MFYSSNKFGNVKNSNKTVMTACVMILSVSQHDVRTFECISFEKKK